MDNFHSFEWNSIKTVEPSSVWFQLHFYDSVGTSIIPNILRLVGRDYSNNTFIFLPLKIFNGKGANRLFKKLDPCKNYV